MINFAPLIMTNFIPLFPLDIVVYPGEKLNLHVFEPRYKQLITECHQTKKPFGIPTVLKSGIGEIGTLVEVSEIVQVYEDGKMDIKTIGIKVFRILEIIKTLPDKLYSGAIVNYPVNEQRYNGELRNKVLSSIRGLHELMKVAKDFSKPDEELTSYDVAHHAALSLDEEYELLGLMREDQRLEYLKRHLLKVLPLVNEMETLKERIKLNGHFKEIKGFNLDL
jgi:Lon protease-like protein